MADRISSVALYFDDFEGGIIQLNSHERGVYFTLCLRYYATGGQLYDDDRTLSRACNCSPQAYKKTKAKLIDMEKIAVVDGMIFQPRADVELASAHRKLNKWKNWKRNKDAKKIEKSLDFSPKKPRKNNEGAKQPKPEGLGFPLTGETPNPKQTKNTRDENPSRKDADASAPARESGGGLSSEGVAILREVRRLVTLSGKASSRDMDNFTRAVLGFDGSTFIASKHDLPEAQISAIRQEIETSGYALQEQIVPRLRVVGE